MDQPSLSEACFRSMVEHGADVITLQRHDGIVVYVSPSVTRVLGYAPEDWLGGRLGHMVHSEDQPLRAEKLAQLLAAPGSTQHAVCRWLHKNGTWRWMQITAVNLIDDPDVRGIVMTQHDITNMRTPIEIAPEAIMVIDAGRSRVIEANSNAASLFAVSRDALLAMVLPAAWDPHLELALYGEQPVFDWEHQGAPYEVRVVRLAGDKPLVRASIFDVSERKRMEQIRARATELEMQNRRIRESSRLKSEFLANMSHELRTPLNAIIGFAELLYDGRVANGSQQQHEFLGSIALSARHLLQMIDDVLDLSKVEAGKLEFRPEPCDVGQLTQEVCAIMRTTAAEKQLRLGASCDPAVHGVTLDPSRFKQVLYNYLSNAIKFTAHGGSVAVRVSPDGDEWFRVEVEDTGIGISPPDIGRLFVEFQQLDSGLSKKHDGTGLGLALTRRLVEAQGGTVGVSSTLGKGSTFFAVLPRRSISGTAYAGRRTPSVVRKGGAPRVLVIEDDLREQSRIVEALMRAGYAVDTADNGSEALARIRSHNFDAVTVDLLLPDMSGIDLLAGIRASGTNASIVIVVLTIVAEEHDLSGLKVHEILHKPFDASALLGALERAQVKPAKRP